MVDPTAPHSDFDQQECDMQMDLFAEEPPRARRRLPRRADIERVIKQEIASLRRQRRDWLAGRSTATWYGLAFHAKPCGEPDCEGCASRGWHNDQAAAISARIEVLTTRLNPIAGEVVPAHVGPQTRPPR